MKGFTIPDRVGIAVLGDVHGNSERLCRALDELSREDRLIILVGDYVNRGPDSRGVLDRLVHAQREMPGRLVLLRGNHEVALLSFLRSGDPRDFLRHKGATTIRSYCSAPKATVLEDFRRDFPLEHLELLEGTFTHAEGTGLLVSHAGFNPAFLDSRAEENIVTGHWPELLESPTPPTPLPLVVFGHYPSLDGVPYDGGPLVGIDTGCGVDPASPLTAIRLPERQFARY